MYSEEGTTSAPLYKLTEKLHISAIWPAQWEALEETIIALRVASEEVQEIRWEVDEEPDEEVGNEIQTLLHMIFSGERVYAPSSDF